MNNYIGRLALHLAALYVGLQRAERGQGMVEYAAILSFLAAITVVAIHFFEPNLAATLNNVANSFQR